MTQNEMIIRLWEILSKPTDLIPVTDFSDDTTLDDTLPGYQKLLGFLVSGFNHVVTWKSPSGNYVNFFRPIKRVTLDLEASSWSIADIDSVSIHTSDTKFSISTIYSSTELTKENVIFRTTDGTDGTVQAPAVISTTPSIFVPDAAYVIDVYIKDATDQLNKDWENWKLHPLSLAFPIQFGAIRRIRDIINDLEIEPVSRQEDFIGSGNIIADPTQYFMEGDSIVFNTAVENYLALEIEYYVTGTDSTDFSDTLSLLPGRFHNLIILWAAYLAKLRASENDVAYSFRGFFESDIKEIMSDYELQTDTYDGGMQA